SEEHTSELQSLTNLVCRLLLEKQPVERDGRGAGAAVGGVDGYGVVEHFQRETGSFRCLLREYDGASASIEAHQDARTRHLRRHGEAAAASARDLDRASSRCSTA